MTFGSKLKEQRVRKELKQTEIAAILDCAPTSLANWENGKIQPSMGVLARLCEILEISPLNLLGKEYSYEDIVGIAGKPVYERKYEEHVALTFSYEILSKPSLNTKTFHVEVEQTERKVEFIRETKQSERSGTETKVSVERDMLSRPSHYTQGKYEVIDVIEDWGLNFNLGNVLKYIGRAKHKGDYKKDLKKALFYIRREIEKSRQADERTNGKGARKNAYHM